MKYIVDSRYYKNGTFIVKIHEVPNDFRIEYFIGSKDCDIWLDEFKSYVEAINFVSQITGIEQCVFGGVERNEKISF